MSAGSLRDIQKRQNNSLEQSALAYTLAQQNGAIAFSPQPGVSGLPRGVRDYRISFVREKVAAFYKDLTTTLAQKYGSDALLAFDPTTYAYLQDPAFGNLLDYLSADGTFDVWADASTGFPVKFVTTLRLVPPDSAVKLKDTQYMLSADLSMNDINKQVTIQAPSGAMTYDDAQILLSGQPKDVYLYSKQLGNIQALRQELNTYKSDAGSYPDSLDQLVVTNAAARKLNPHPPTSTSMSPVFYNDDIQIASVIPYDAFTGQPYGYTNNGTDYAITYTMQIPTSTSTPSSPDEYLPYSNVKIVNGTNTATSKTNSVEGDAHGASYKGADDATKLSDLRTVQNALEIFYNKNGKYPTEITSWSSLQAKLQSVNGGVAAIPDDHRAASGIHYCYAATAQGSDYVLSAALETPSADSSILMNNYSGVVPTGGGMKCSCGPSRACVTL